MRCVAVWSWVVLLCAGFACAQDSCFPYIGEACEGIPENYDCVNVTTDITSNKGGEHTAFLQEFCFKEGSPLFGEITVSVSVGTLDIPALKVGDELGELLFDVSFSLFGEVCPVGDQATLRAPITVIDVSEQYAEVHAVVVTASDPLITCLLTYDPKDADHNGGLMLQGSITTSVGGGFELYLKLADLAEGASSPGLEYGDLSSSGSPVPLYFRPLTKSDIYTLPAAGGKLTVDTLLTNGPAEKEFLEEFTITPGVVVPQFQRGDVNEDGALNIADPIRLLGHLFGGQAAPGCPDAGDGNDDGALNIADAIKILGHLFGGTGPLPAPFGKCGPDETADSLPPCVFDPQKCP